MAVEPLVGIADVAVSPRNRGKTTLVAARLQEPASSGSSGVKVPPFKEKGRREGKEEVARNLLSILDDETIARTSSLSIEEGRAM